MKTVIDAAQRKSLLELFDVLVMAGVASARNLEERLTSKGAELGAR